MQNCRDKKSFLRIFFFICSLHLSFFLPPLPKVQCPNFFYIFGILGENLWKEVVSDLKTFAYKGCKIAAPKKVCFLANFGYQDFFGINATIRIGREMLCLPYAGFSKHRPSGPMLSISQNVPLSVRMCVCPSVRHLFTFEVPFKRLFAPTSQSWLSNIFRDSVSLGKSNGKKWSQV